MSEDGGEPTGTAPVRCACGGSVAVDPATAGKEQTCPSCAARFRVVWVLDPKTREKRLTRVPPKGSPIYVPPGAYPLTCTCGQILVARKEQAGKKVRCPVCNASMQIERIKDPLTLETRILRTQTSSKETATEIVPAKPLGRTTRRRKAPSGAQDILCACGEYLRVVAENLEKKVMCPACGTLMKLDKVKDSQSITQVRPRIVGKTEPPAKADPDAWSMDDFS